MAFTVYNDADTAIDDLAELHKVDLAILAAGIGGVAPVGASGVLEGGAVTAQGSPDNTVAVAVGKGRAGGRYVEWTAGNVTITAAHASLARMDMVSVSQAGTKTYTAGTAAANPTPPDIPANHVPLAVVYVPATDTTISSDQIVDKRVFVERPDPELTIVTSDSPAWMRALADYVADGTGDNAELTLAIAEAQAAIVSTTYGVPRILVPTGQLNLSSAVQFGSAPVIGGSTPNNGNRIIWNGADAATVFTKDKTLTGGYGFWEFAGFNFRKGTGTPLTWLDVDDGDIDAMFWLHHLHFVGSSGPLLTMGGWTNAFFNDLRFDGAGTYAMSWLPGSSQNLGVASLDRFTFDNDPSTTTKGVFLIDNTASASQLGVFAISNGRVEYNFDLVSPAAFIHLKEPNPGNSRAVGLLIENTTIDDVSATASDFLVYMETAATSLSASLVMVNVRQTGLSAIFGGTLWSGHPVVPVQSAYGLVAINAGGSSSGFSTITDSFRLSSVLDDGSAIPWILRRGTETQNRLQISEVGVISWGSGSVAVDTELKRISADLLGTPDSFRADGGIWSTAVVTKNGNATLTLAEDTILAGASGGAFTLTLPTAAGCTGKRYVIKKTDSSANAVTIDGNGSETIDGALTTALPFQYDSIEIVSDNTNWLVTFDRRGALVNVAAATPHTGAISTADTALSVTHTIPANTLRPGRWMRVTARGVYGTHSTGTLTIQLKLKFGSTTLTDTGVFTLIASQTNRGWEFINDVIVDTSGGSGTVEAQGMSQFISGTLPASAAAVTDAEKTATVTVDTTASQVITISATIGGTNAANTITMRQLIVESLN